jgi:transcriptional regulator with XRE-family HTH domain
MVKLIETVYKDGRKQGDIAVAAGLTPSALSRILNGHTRPQRRSIYRLADALGVQVDSLIGGTRQKKGGAKCK